MLPNVSGFNEKIKKIEELALGPYEKRVAVLGAFDTWVLMHNVAAILATAGYTAVTSRYNYVENEFNNSYSRYENKPDTPNQSMTNFLQENVINCCSRAIILFSVPAAHYNEVEWCSKLGKKTLGIALVREIYKEDMCPECVVNYQYSYAYCIGKDNA